MRYEEILEELQRVIEDLREENRAMPVIVEGEKDTAALRALDLGGKVLTVNSGLPVFNFCEEIAKENASAIIMTDWDTRGGKLSRRLQEGLEANGVKPVLEYRQRIAVLCRKDLKDVEGLPNYIRTLERWTKEQRHSGAKRRTEESLRRARGKRGGR